MNTFTQKSLLLALCLFLVTVMVHAQQISGNIFSDRDGLTDNNINQSGTVNNPTTNLSATVPLYANLVNNANQVVASVLINGSGTYLFNNIVPGNYSVQLTVNASNGTYATPLPAPTILLPPGWANTGEYIGNTAGSDGVVNGESATITIAPSQVVTDVNFGIDHRPETLQLRALVPTPYVGDLITLNNSFYTWYGPINSYYYSAVFLGNDPEDYPTPGVLTSKTIRIDTLLINTSSLVHVSLIYNGSPVTAGQIIYAYNPLLLKVKCTSTFSTGLLDFYGGPFRFYYSYLDEAGIADNTPALYELQWPVGGPLPIVLSDFRVANNNCNASISWKTYSEIDSDKFGIECSMDGNNHFNEIGTIAASGNSSSFNSYSYNYLMKNSVVYFFRIKMYMKDGTFKYSEIRKLSCTNNTSRIVVVPNVTSNIFSVTGLQNGLNSLSIYNCEGRIIKTLGVTNNKMIDVSNLEAGVYILKIINESGISITDRLIKL